MTLFNDWQDIALASAEAKFEMRELKVEEFHPTGLLHAYVETKLTAGRVHWRDIADAYAFLRRSNLVIMIEDNAIQPVAGRTVSNQGSTVVLAFDFDVSPKYLLNPVTVITVDGDDGRKHQKKADLAGILDPDWNSKR